MSACHLSLSESAVQAVAHWMANQVQSFGRLRHREAVRGISERFGDGFFVINRNGHKGISPVVLREFRKLTLGCVRWNKRRYYWCATTPAGDSAETEWR